MDMRAEFNRKYGRKPEFLVRAPGKVNLLGEHVEFNNGPVLTLALDKSVTIAAAPREDDVVILYAHDLDEHVSFSLSALEENVDLDGFPLSEWAHYPVGIAKAIRDSGFEVQGLEAVYTSNIPVGAELGSSAAVEVGFAVLWQSLGKWSLEKMKLAQLCQRAENDYVGVESGLVGQFASVYGVEGHALYFDIQNLEWEALPLLPNKTIIVADSGMRQDPISAAYQERRESCAQAVELLSDYLPNIRSLRDVSPTEIAAYGYYLPLVVKSRAEHVIREIARVQTGLSAMKRADARALGALMYSSHASLRDLYEVSTPELDALVDIARELPGCLGAHMTGMGFGGCTVNLVEDIRVVEFEAGLKSHYLEKTGLDAAIYKCQAGDGVSSVML